MLNLSSNKDPNWLPFIETFFQNPLFKDRNAITFVKVEDGSVKVTYIGGIRRNVFVITRPLISQEISLTKTGSLKITGTLNEVKMTYLVSLIKEDYNKEINNMISDKRESDEIKRYITEKLNLKEPIFDSLYNYISTI